MKNISSGLLNNKLPSNAVGKSGAGFTLLELLIVIGILAILATAAVLVLNPAELLRQARDSNRLTDLQNIHNSLALYQASVAKPDLGLPNVISVSIPDPSSTECNNVSSSLPSLPPTWKYHCGLTADYRKVDGNGWIPVNFAQMPQGSPFSLLPVDPVNDATSSQYYAYVPGGSWVLTGTLESQKLSIGAKTDQGTDDTRIEIGTDLNLWTKAQGLVGYWKFDEGGGTTAADSSGNGNVGVLTAASWIAGKSGQAVSFPGPGTYAYVNANAISSFYTPPFSASVWLKFDALPTGAVVLEKLRTSGLTWHAWNLQALATKYMLFTTWNAAETPISVTSNSTVVTDTWYQLVVTLDASYNLAMYVNGVKQSGTKNSGSLLNTNPGNLYIGNSFCGVLCTFPGIMDGVRMYNRALKATEIQVLYNATK